MNKETFLSYCYTMHSRKFADELYEFVKKYKIPQADIMKLIGAMRLIHEDEVKRADDRYIVVVKKTPCGLTYSLDTEQYPPNTTNNDTATNNKTNKKATSKPSKTQDKQSIINKLKSIVE